MLERKANIAVLYLQIFTWIAFAGLYYYYYYWPERKADNHTAI
jgi:hypothetical protein